MGFLPYLHRSGYDSRPTYTGVHDWDSYHTYIGLVGIITLPIQQLLRFLPYLHRMVVVPAVPTQESMIGNLALLTQECMIGILALPTQGCMIGILVLPIKDLLGLLPCLHRSCQGFLSYLHRSG